MNDSLHSHSTSGMPRLRRLDVNNILPRPGFADRLTSCSIKISTYDGAGWDYSMLLHFLQPLSVLHTLSLSLDDEGFVPPERMQEAIKLPALKTFKLHSRMFNSLALAHLVRFLHMPILEAYDLDLWIEVRMTSESVLRTPFPAHNTYSSVSTISLVINGFMCAAEVNGQPESNPLTLLDIVLDRFHHLRHIAIETADGKEGDFLSLSRPEYLQSLSALETLRLRGCNHFTGVRVRRLVHLLKDTFSPCAFKRVEVAECPKLRRELLLDGLQAEQIEWKE